MRNLCGQAPASSASTVDFSEFDGVQSSSGGTTAFLGLPGAFAMDNQFAPLLPTIVAGVNHATFVNYIGVRFDTKVVADAVKVRLRGLLSQYDQVMIFGSSTGGPIASLVIDDSFSVQEKSRITLLLGCSPAGKTTLQPDQQKSVETAESLSKFFNGNLSWAEDPFWRWLFIAFKLLKIDYGSQYQADQGMFNGSYTPLAPGSLAGLKRVAYFKAASDKTVDGDKALLQWQMMRGTDLVVSYTESGDHVGFAEPQWKSDVGHEIDIMKAALTPAT
jgi:hypothetical protein